MQMDSVQEDIINKLLEFKKLTGDIEDMPIEEFFDLVLDFTVDNFEEDIPANIFMALVMTGLLEE